MNAFRGDKSGNDGIIINEVQLLLAEKRTTLALMRTGIAVLALPLSICGLLVATSRYYVFGHVLAILLPLLALCAVLIFLGFYLIVRSFLRLHHHDRLILQIKQKHNKLNEFLE